MRMKQGVELTSESLTGKQLGVMAKYWRPGAVKTRLAATIGPRRAAEIYRAILTTTLRRMSTVEARRVVAYAPADSRTEFAELVGREWGLQSQGGGDLGQRMERFFRIALENGRDRIVLIGSDSPSLPPDLVVESFEQLNHADVVLGPSEDGGYYLIGIKGRIPPMFQDIPWSSDRVWKTTVQLLTDHQCPFVELPRWYDVDEYEDLVRLWAQLNGELPSAPAFDSLRDVLAQTLFANDSTLIRYPHE